MSKKKTAKRKTKKEIRAQEESFLLKTLGPSPIKSRAELTDADYLDKLSEEEKLWYARFLQEYVHDSRTHIKKGFKPILTDGMLKDARTAANKRRADVFNRGFRENEIPTIPDIVEKAKARWDIYNPVTEDDMIKAIDKKRSKRK